MSLQEPWLEAVALGDFSALPQHLSFSASAGLAHLIDGYAVAGSFVEAARLARETLRHREATGVWLGSALDLWVCLFFLHRASRHTGSDEEDSENPLFNELSEVLLGKLRALNVNDASAIKAVMKRWPAP